jgi:hypothetical protein
MEQAPATPELRPRYGRITAFGAATLVCATAFLGGVGVLPDGGAPADASPRSRGAIELSGSESSSSTKPGAQSEPTSSGSGASHGRIDKGVEGESQPTPRGTRPLPKVADDVSVAAKDTTDFPLPADSGTGRRVVFDLEQQRVWLVGARGGVKRTYLASGSVTDNLRPGTFEVYSRSEHATGIDGTTMRWMVRFTHGDNAAIGFHDLPLGDDGHPVQRLRDLGTPQSHGCIRQAPGDAQALWTFAPVGTKVVVTG